MGQNRIEKIVQKYAVNLPADYMVHAGDFVTVRPKHVMTHDNSSAVIAKFRAIGASRLFDPSQPVMPLDHDVQNESDENLAKYASIEQFAREQGNAFFPAKSGIGHQIMAEEGFVLPGTLVVGSDSHSNLYGALGALGTPVVRTDAAAIWATGETWWQIPPVVRVKLEGDLGAGVSGKDLILTLIGHFRSDEVLNCAIEFEGSGVGRLSMDQRLAISNMTTEWGALVGYFPYDEVVRDYLLSRAEVMAKRGDAHPRLTASIVEKQESEVVVPDDDAFYAKEIVVDLASISPHVSGPNSVKITTSLAEIEKKRVAVQKAYLLSCVNSRLEDIEDAARVLRGKKVADGVEMYLAAASAGIEAAAKETGAWQVLLDAGAIALPPGCGPCIGLGKGTLEKGETGISATNRNFKGRMGHPDALAYLASPAVVAASAAAGYISAPERGEALEIRAQYSINRAEAKTKEKISVRDGFPRRIEGRLLLLPEDNLNTDGIYGKDVTYRDDLTREEMGRAAFLNYDPRFQEVAREGDIVVSGWNFGTGSSREQAATAIQYRGVRLIIAGSFSQTYKRNAFNNGFIVIECPELMIDLRNAHSNSKELTVDTGVVAIIDFELSEITAAGKSYTFSPLREVPQELVAGGGFESVLKQRLAKS